MFALGIIGIFQVLFFPEMIVNKYLRFPKNVFFFISTVIAFSLISNFLVVFLLTTIGIFIQPVVIFLIIVEFGFIVFLYHKELININLGEGISKTWNEISKAIHEAFPKIENDDNQFQKFFQYGLFLMSLVISIIAIE